MPLRWAGAWIYVGHDYLRMRHWEKRLAGARTSLSKEIQLQSVELRPQILDWIRRQREANNDSLHWWMSFLAGRSNSASRFFGYVFQIAALKQWIQGEGQAEGEVLVLCEDGFILRAVLENLQDAVPTRTRPGWRLGWLWDWVFWFARAVYCLLRQLRWFWRHARVARLTRARRVDPPRGQVFLVHQCLDDKSFLKDGPLACRYFTTLPAWLERQGKQVVRLPWLFGVTLPLEQVYRRLRESACLIPEDWLGWRDYVSALINGFRSVFAIRLDVDLRSVKGKALVVRERCDQLGTGFALAGFWCYGPAIERWGRSISKLVMLSHYEAMPSERVQISTWRARMRAPSQFIGYFHSLVSRDFLSSHTPRGEADSRAFPDVIVTNGPLATKLLNEQGVPTERLRTGPALRGSFDASASIPPDGNRTGLLLLLSLIPEAAVETLDKMSLLAPWIRERLAVPVIVKPHPMMTKQSILHLVGWTHLPGGWRWHDGEIAEALRTAKCAVALNTASIIDAVVSGCVPLSLTRALDAPWNGLDFLEDAFPILRAVPDELIQMRLEEIFVTHRGDFESESRRVRKCLLEGLSPVSDDLMRAFVC